MFLVNSRFFQITATTPKQKPEKQYCPGLVPLIPKLRGHFAEFLNHDSLARLSILYLTT